MEETISSMAGAENGSDKTVADLRALATGLGRPASQRTTVYGHVEPERQAAAELLNQSFARQPSLVAVNQERS
jgi:FO synthase